MWGEEDATNIWLWVPAVEAAREEREKESGGEIRPERALIVLYLSLSSLTSFHGPNTKKSVQRLTLEVTFSNAHMTPPFYETKERFVAGLDLIWTRYADSLTFD